MDSKAVVFESYFPVWVHSMRHSYGESVTLVDASTGAGDSLAESVAGMMAADGRLGETLRTHFNTSNPDGMASLESRVRVALGGSGSVHSPVFTCLTEESALVESLKKGSLSPCLSFVDLWGLPGITLRIMEPLLAGVWGCDAFFMLDYGNVRANLGNKAASDYLKSLFGGEEAQVMEEAAWDMDDARRELFIVNAVGEALETVGGKFVIPFRVQGAEGDGSRYAFFVSRHYEGYDIMKVLIHVEMKSKGAGGRRFEYVETKDESLSLLHGFSPKQEKLRNQLLRTFAGQFLPVRQVYSKHNRRTRYTKEDYQKALLKLERRGIIRCTPSDRRQGTMADNVMVTFPSTFTPVTED